MPLPGAGALGGSRAEPQAQPHASVGWRRLTLRGLWESENGDGARNTKEYDSFFLCRSILHAFHAGLRALES